MAIDPSKLEELRAKHPRLRVVEHADVGSIVVRPPTRQEYRKYKILAVSDDKQENAIAQETLILDCVIHPTREDFVKLLDTYPGLDSYKPLINAVKELMGQVESTEGKG